MRRNVWYLVVTVVLIVGTFVATLVSGKTPILGLDLQGGFSVVLSPVGNFKSGSLDVARDIIETRVNGLGVAEPEISRQGNTIVVDLPGVKDRNKAERLVGRTAQLRFRPVLANATTIPGLFKVPASATTTTKPNGSTSTTAPESTTTTTTPPDDSAVRQAVASCNQSALAGATEIPTTRVAQDKAGDCVVLPVRDAKGNRLLLGPAVMSGNDVSSAKRNFASGQGYVVDMKLKSGGLDKFNKLAQKSFSQPSPTNEVAIVLDGVVQSNPAFQASNFSGPVQISGSFTAGQAEDLAKLINYGALPVRLVQQTAQSVSPTLGNDQLRAGIIAGVIGLALVAIYMLVYYRLLGLVVILGLVLSGMAIYSLVTWLGVWISLTMTLAGVTGIIVSVGITVDSYVVYFERLKDEVRAGATVRSSVDRAFYRSFRTILAADLVSLIGAVVLYVVAIGSVRGFAFYLGLSTVLDLLIAYFFMHPLVSILARRSALVTMPGVGLAAGLDAREAIA